jgi:hypothetical protein
MGVIVGYTDLYRCPFAVIWSNKRRLQSGEGLVLHHLHSRRTNTCHRIRSRPTLKSPNRTRSVRVAPLAAQPDRQVQDWKQGLWTAVDLTATLGSVGGAIAFVLTQEAMLVGLPVVLPLLALYASRKREKAVLEVCHLGCPLWRAVLPSLVHCPLLAVPVSNSLRGTHV